MDTQPARDKTQLDQSEMTYQTPVLIDHGAIETLTQEGDTGAGGAQDFLAVSKTVF